MIAAELGLGGPSRAGARDVPEGFRAIVIGAGVSGLAPSILLAEAGIPHVVLERNDTVGGTWLENRYPGAGVDTPSALYSFSFAQHDWSKYFALRDELHAYLEDVADDVRRARSGSASAPRCGARPTTRPRRSGTVRSSTARRDAARQRRDHARSAASTRRSARRSPAWSAFAGPVRAHRPLAGRPRPGRQARRRDRQRRQRDAARARRSARTAAHSPSSSARRSGRRRSSSSTQRCPRRARWLLREVPLYRVVVPAALGLDVQRPRPPGAAEGPGVGAPGALAERDQRRPPRVLHAVHRVRARRPTRAAREGACRTTRRSASGCCWTTAGTGRCSATTSSWSPTRSPTVDRARRRTAARARRAGAARPASTSCASWRRWRSAAAAGCILREVWDDEDARAYLGTAVPASRTSSCSTGRTRRPATAAA